MLGFLTTTFLPKFNDFCKRPYLGKWLGAVGGDYSRVYLGIQMVIQVFRFRALGEGTSCKKGGAFPASSFAEKARETLNTYAHGS